MFENSFHYFKLIKYQFHMEREISYKPDVAENPLEGVVNGFFLKVFTA